jgi:hypothetical protein
VRPTGWAAEAQRHQAEDDQERHRRSLVRWCLANEYLRVEQVPRAMRSRLERLGVTDAELSAHVRRPTEQLEVVAMASKNSSSSVNQNGHRGPPITVQWVEALPPVVRAPGRWEAVAITLRTRPGEWAFLGVHPAAALSYCKRQQLEVAERKTEEPGKVKLYARAPAREQVSA